nr:helix-turn-helix domain-containing protein [uncultured Allomuricauda sp.]
MLAEPLLLIGTAQAFFLAFVMAFAQEKGLPDKWLIIWLLFIGIHLYFVHLGFSGTYRNYPVLIVFGSALMLLQGPFLFLYTSIATNRIKSLRIVHLMHAIPYIFFTGYIAYIFFNLPPLNRYAQISNMIRDEKNGLVVFLGVLNHVHIIIYLFFSFLLLKKHLKELTETLSFVENLNLKWFKNLLVGISVVALTILIGILTSDFFPFVSHYFKASLIYSAFALLPFYMTFYAIRQKLVYPKSYENLDKKYERSKLTQIDSKRIADELIQYMRLKKPYLNPVLSIRELSEELNVHPKNLSRVINENFGKNFFNFVNDFRVVEFKARIRDPENSNYTLIAIAYDCGFNTKSSFNSIFKRTTGMTPSAYKAQFKFLS